MYGPKKAKALSKLTFEPKKHVYHYDGFRVPSVTQILDPMLPYAGLPRDIKEIALRRGDLVHQLTQRVDQGKSWEQEAKDTGLSGYIEAWEAFKQFTEFKVEDIELRLYHEKYRYAGTLDRTGRLYGQEHLSIIEIKTGSLVPEYALQTAAYLEAFNQGRTENKARDRYVIQLEADGIYKVLQHTDRADFGVFVAALTISNWRMRRN